MQRPSIFVVMGSNPTTVTMVLRDEFDGNNLTCILFSKIQFQLQSSLE